MELKKRIFLVTALFYIAYTVFPIFADIFHIPVWLPSMLSFVIMLVLCPNAYSNKPFFWFTLYALALGIYVIVGKPLTIGIGSVQDSKKIFIEFAYILPALSIFSILSYLDDMNLTRKMVRWSLGLLYVSFIITFPLMRQYNSIRDALAEQGEDFRVPGLPGYSLMHAYTLLVPAMCYAVKASEKKKKLLALVGLAVLCFMVYDTFVTTSLIIMIAVLAFAILYKENSKSMSYLVMSIAAVTVFVLYQMGFFIALIDWIMPAFENTAVASKLEDFRASMLQGSLTGRTITGRQDLHAVSWQSFFHNPIFGTPVVGGHSALVDRLGGMGLFAGLPFIMMIVSFIRMMIRRFQTRGARTFFWVGVIAGFVFLYEKGLWGCESWLMYCVLMPMMIYVLDESKANENIDLESELNNTTI